MILDTEPQIPMGWKFFLVDRGLSNDEIASTFAEIFEIDQDDVLLIEETDDISEDLPKNIQLVCERSIVKGDFQISISVYPQDSELENIAEEIGGELEIVNRFSEILQCDCLIIDPPRENLEDEDAFLLIKGLEGIIQEVYIDHDNLNNEEYFIFDSDEINKKEKLGWKLLLVDQDLLTNEIIQAFSEIFSINSQDIIIVEETDEIGEALPDNIRLIFDKFSIKGDFKIAIAIDLLDAEIVEVSEEIGDLVIVKKICNILHCNCLILEPNLETDDKDISFLVQYSEESIKLVYLDQDKLEKEQYHLK